MKYKSKDIRRAVRDLNNITLDILNADHKTYQNLIGRFVEFIRNNSIMNHIINPLLNIQLDISDILEIPKGGRGKLILPTDVKEHIALVLQLFCAIYDKNYHFRNFLGQYYTSKHQNDNIYEFNSQVVRPAFRELLLKLEDFIEDELSEKESINDSNLQIFHIGNIDTKGGNVAIGKDIIQIVEFENIKENLIKELLDAGFSIDKIDEARPIIDEVEVELKKSEFNKSTWDIILTNLYNIGEKVMVQSLINVISKPEIIAAANEFLNKL